ncbi:17956_t:CDS:1, partial [Acaulospora morrowiae]
MVLPYVIFTLTETPFLTNLRIWKYKFNVNKPTRRKQSQLVSLELRKKFDKGPKVTTHNKNTQEKRHKTRRNSYRKPSNSIWSKYLELSKKGELHSFSEGDFL